MVPRPPTPVKLVRADSTKAQSTLLALRVPHIPERVVQGVFVAVSPRRAKLAQSANTKVPVVLLGRRALPTQRRATLERLKGTVPRPRIPVKRVLKANIRVPTTTLGRHAVLIN